MTIAVTGATGQLGQLVIAKLKQKTTGSNIVALVCRPEKPKTWVSLPDRPIDAQPAMLEAALSGVETLLLIFGNEISQRAIQHANVIAAAKKSGVKRIVYTGLLHADTSPLNLAPEHAETEKTLKASGIDYTILRNGWYTENYIGSIAPALANGAFYGCAGEGKIASAAREDFAESAVVVLTEQGHSGKTYELAGDEPYTLAQLAAEVTKQSGKQIPYTDIPEADYAAALKGTGRPEGFAAAIASWDVGESKGGLYEASHQLSALIGRPTTTPLSVSVAAALKAL